MTHSEWSRENLICECYTRMTTCTLSRCTSGAMGVRWWWMDSMLFHVDYRSLNWLSIKWMANAWTHNHTLLSISPSLPHFHMHRRCAYMQEHLEIYYTLECIKFKMLWIAEILWAKKDLQFVFSSHLISSLISLGFFLFFVVCLFVSYSCSVCCLSNAFIHTCKAFSVYIWYIYYIFIDVSTSIISIGVSVVIVGRTCICL